MADIQKNPFDLFLDSIRQVIREEIREALSNGQVVDELISPEELSKRISVPVSWVYEQSRLNEIPTHRVGRYIRFRVAEVLESQKKKKKAD
jgi:excisionase family DNA binding protein